jgi:hypothetical protein
MKHVLEVQLQQWNTSASKSFMHLSGPKQVLQDRSGLRSLRAAAGASTQRRVHLHFSQLVVEGQACPVFAPRPCRAVRLSRICHVWKCQQLP